MIRYAVPLFVGAFLVFEAELLLGKALLPWFGGGPNVWLVCLVFFQLALLAGYLYAFILSCLGPLRWQQVGHGLLLLLSLYFMPILPDRSLQPNPHDNPTWSLLLLLTRTIGLPFLLLTASTPLLQAWAAAASQSRINIYRYYALSNAGSLLGLLSYPILVEPLLPLNGQNIQWTAVYLCFVGSILYLIGSKLPAAPKDELVTPISISDLPVKAPAAFPWWRMPLWFLWSAAGSMLLMAATNQLCQEISIAALFLSLPLAVYLLTFILCFDRPWLYQRLVFLPGWYGLLGLLVVPNYLRASHSVTTQLALYLGLLGTGCMITHGELTRLQPATRWLTLFYLIIAAGGAAGGMVVSIIAPLLLDDYWEFPFLLLFITILALLTSFFELENQPETPTASAAPGQRWFGLAMLPMVSLWAFIGFHVLRARQDITETSAQLLLSNEQWHQWYQQLATLLVLVPLIFYLGRRWFGQKSLFHFWFPLYLIPIVWLNWTMGFYLVWPNSHSEWREWVPTFCYLLVPASVFCLLPDRWNNRLYLAIQIPCLLLPLSLLVTTMTFRMNNQQIVRSERNFFGVLKVEDKEMPGTAAVPARKFRELVHGPTLHGLQFLEPGWAHLPTTYYGADSGIGLAFACHPDRHKNLRFGGIGLGVGTIASYGQSGDWFKFYEINPAVLQIAQTEFSFLKRCPAQLQVALGDARVILEQERRQQQYQQFDILAIDAFSGDAIPLHLLTQESFALFASHLAEEGILAFHLSNLHFDLRPVVRKLATTAGWQAILVRQMYHDVASGTNSSDWVLCTRHRTYLDHPLLQPHHDWPEGLPTVSLWTDQYTNLLEVLK